MKNDHIAIRVRPTRVLAVAPQMPRVLALVTTTAAADASPERTYSVPNRRRRVEGQPAYDPATAAIAAAVAAGLIAGPIPIADPAALLDRAIADAVGIVDRVRVLVSPQEVATLGLIAGQVVAGLHAGPHQIEDPGALLDTAVAYAIGIVGRLSARTTPQNEWDDGTA